MRFRQRNMVAGWLVAAILGSATLVQADDEALRAQGLGQRASNFTLRDASTDQNIMLYGYAGKKAVVLVFTGTDCAVGNLYMPRLVELADQYRHQGVVFLGINSHAHETPQQIAAHAQEYGLNFPVLKDIGNVVADLFFVDRTCEAIVLDGRARLRYRGAIDDQYGLGTRKNEPENYYLVEALEAVLADREVDVAITPVAGCLIDRQASPDPEPARSNQPRIRAAPSEIVEALDALEADEPTDLMGEVTYASHVAAILQAKCQSCHRPGQVAPFSLLTYDQARRWSAMIREVVEERRMPPWHADPRHGQFENDRRLSARQRATLLAWVDQGAPLGEPEQIPPSVSFPEGWTIGEPDLVFEMPEAYTVAAQGALPYQRFLVATHFTEDRWVQAAEARPGDRSVVHHIIVYVDDHSGNRDRWRTDAHLVAYAPGDLPSVYPPGTAKKIPAGSDLIFEMHYTPIGQVKTDRSAVGLIFAPEPPEYRAKTLGIANSRFIIPAGAEDYPVKSSHTFDRDVYLLNLLPHMHLRGKSFQYTAVYPDGSREVLLSVPAYDFAWQTLYRLTEPKLLPAGTRIDCLAHFDNSPNNPALTEEDIKTAVKWGEQTWDEMMIGYIDFVEREDQTAAEPDAPQPSQTQEDPVAAPAPAAPRALETVQRVLRALRGARNIGSGP